MTEEQKQELLLWLYGDVNDAIDMAGNEFVDNNKS